MYGRGAGGPRDLAAAIDVITPAAKAGDAPAQLELGLLYADAARQPRSPAAALDRSGFAELMDTVFGSGNWRETSGYRTPAEENRLRASGAGTVPVGEVSRHSLGSAEAPGAYDVVVSGMAADSAAVRLRRSSAKVSRVLPERAYGDQGPHLHVEVLLGAAYARHWGGKGATVSSAKGADATSAGLAEQSQYWLQLAAQRGEARAVRALAMLRMPRSPN
jgi:TPR repeat protein